MYYEEDAGVPPESVTIHPHNSLKLAKYYNLFMSIEWGGAMSVEGGG